MVYSIQISVLLVAIVHSQIKASVAISVSLSNIGVPLNQEIDNIHVTSWWRQVKWRRLQSEETYYIKLACLRTSQDVLTISNELMNSISVFQKKYLGRFKFKWSQTEFISIFVTTVWVIKGLLWHLMCASP